tara:strand:- start:4713 stop:5345 length:633 start_codon:yes stop_codon:yes gene_type:complete
MSKKFNNYILVSMRQLKIKSIDETRDTVDQKLLEWIIELGFEPFLISNKLSKKIKLNNIKNICGIILSGGSEKISRLNNRFKVEKKLINFSIKKKIPILGICRGMQMLGFTQGANIKKIKNHVKTRHKLLIEKKYSSLYPLNVNSYHNESVENVEEKFNIIAKAKDEVIEAFEHKLYPWLGWMWHPEREKVFNKKNLSLARKFFNKKYEN